MANTLRIKRRLTGSSGAPTGFEEKKPREDSAAEPVAVPLSESPDIPF